MGRESYRTRGTTINSAQLEEERMRGLDSRWRDALNTLPPFSSLLFFQFLFILNPRSPPSPLLFSPFFRGPARYRRSISLPSGPSRCPVLTRSSSPLVHRASCTGSLARIHVHVICPGSKKRALPPPDRPRGQRPPSRGAGSWPLGEPDARAAVNQLPPFFPSSFLLCQGTLPPEHVPKSLTW